MVTAQHVLSSRFFSRKRVEPILQTEIAECGLACLVMIARFHGDGMLSIDSARKKLGISARGATLLSLVQLSSQLHLASRAVRAEVEDLGNLQLPCILHWCFTHFVVLEKIHRHSFTIVDPVIGRRVVKEKEFLASFTGVALELWPDSGLIKTRDRRPRIRLRDLVGPIGGALTAIVQCMALALALEVFAILGPFYFQWVIDNALVANDHSLLKTLGISFFLLLLFQQILTAARSWTLLFIGTSFTIQWRSNVFSHLLKLPVEYFEKRHVGDVQSRFMSIDRIQQTLTISFTEGVIDGVMAVITLCILFIYSTQLAWISISAVALYGLARLLWFRPLRAATEQAIVQGARQQTHFLETLRGIRTIKLFQRREIRQASWLTTLVNQVNADVRSQKLAILYRLCNGVILGSENVLVIWIGAELVLSESLSIGMLVAYVAYKTIFSNRVTSLIDKGIDLRMMGLQAERLADIVLTPPEESGYANPVVDDNKAPVVNTDAVTVKGLCFRYAEHEDYVLQDLNFSIPSGQSVAIAGPSGCGKTTLLLLLVGVLKPTSGSIIVYGKELGRASADDFRAILGTVMQDDTLFEGTIEDNICFFDPNRDQHRIEECARLSSIHDDIMSMPMGYHSLVGYMGSVLSGGQRQRLLLARALYKRPKLLALDEATSHLDVRRERQVNSAIRNLNITRIFVAHRPETIMSADRVLSMEGGRLVADSAESLQLDGQ